MTDEPISAPDPAPASAGANQLAESSTPTASPPDRPATFGDQVAMAGEEPPPSFGEQILMRSLTPSDFGEQIAGKAGLPKEIEQKIDEIEKKEK
jgi:hypothetical protein